MKIGGSYTNQRIMSLNDIKTFRFSWKGSAVVRGGSSGAIAPLNFRKNCIEPLKFRKVEGNY